MRMFNCDGSEGAKWPATRCGAWASTCMTAGMVRREELAIETGSGHASSVSPVHLRRHG